jgi:hypothetical protein
MREQVAIEPVWKRARKRPRSFDRQTHPPSVNETDSAPNESRSIQRLAHPLRQPLIVGLAADPVFAQGG